MPHRRRKKKEANSRLVFNLDKSLLYLSVLSVSEDTAVVPLETFLVLFVIKYAGAEERFKVHFVLMAPDDERCLQVVVRRESVGREVALEKEVPKPVSCCR
jgi:hypothetical protein